MRRTAALGSIVAVLAMTAGLAGWMTAKVAEHPGIPREVGALPPWFTGAPGAPRKAPERSPATAGAAVAHAHAPSSAAGAPGVIVAADGGFVEVAGGKIEVALTEYEMKPSRIRVGPGKVVFVLRNEGRYAHDFHVEGPGVDAYAARFAPGRVVQLEATLQEGEYKISCPLSNHNERGMQGTLIATSSLAAK